MSEIALNKRESTHYVEDDACFVTTDPELISQARRLTAKEYLKRKFITPSDVDTDGTIKAELDPYQAHSTNYVMTTPDHNHVSATVSGISFDQNKGESSFPIFKHKAALYPEYIEEIEALGYENLIEISALVRDKELDKDGTAAIRLYKKLFLDAWSNDKTGNSTFIMACNPVLFENFRMLFDGSMKRIGPDLPYPGQEAVPAMFSNREGAVNIIDMSRNKKNPYRGVQREVVEYFLAGSDESKIHPDVIDALIENGYEELLGKMRSGEWGDISQLDKTISGRIKRAAAVGKAREYGSKHKPEIVANGVLMGYTALRTVIVGGQIDPVSDVEWQAFLAIELGTQLPYVWGVGDLVRGAGKSKEEYPTRRKLGAMAAAASAFVAPYAYLAAEGAGNTQQGIVASAGVVAIGAVPMAAKSVKNKLKNRKRPKAEKLTIATSDMP